MNEEKRDQQDRKIKKKKNGFPPPKKRTNNPLLSFFRFIGGIFRSIVYILRNLQFLLKWIFAALTDRLRFSIRLKVALTYFLNTIVMLSLLFGGVLIAFVKLVPQDISQIYAPFLWNVLILAFLIGLLIAIFQGSRAGKKMVEPIHKMNETVREISINNLSKRIEVSGVKDELKDLAMTFNGMMDQIQTSVEKQNQFVSDASHELRTPISVLKGYADLLDRWGKEEEHVRDEAILAIRQESEHMKDLIEKLLFLARGDLNVQKMDKEKINVQELVQEIYRETCLIDKTHQIELGKTEERIIYGDRNMIKEAIRIFVENSIKYTPQGGTITLTVLGEDHKVKISVKDTGEGIAEEDLRKIFLRFYRGDKSRSKKSGGTGLGLAIAKWIIDIHQGKIFARSKVGIGSEFWLVLPEHFGERKPLQNVD